MMVAAFDTVIAPCAVHGGIFFDSTLALISGTMGSITAREPCGASVTERPVVLPP
jgi:hypothetical protein